MSDFDMDAFRRQMSDDFAQSVHRQVDELLQKARRSAPYPRHRKHDCHVYPVYAFDPASPDGPTFLGYRTDDGAYIITTLAPEGDQQP